RRYAPRSQEEQHPPESARSGRGLLTALLALVSVNEQPEDQREDQPQADREREKIKVSRIGHLTPSLARPQGSPRRVCFERTPAARRSPDDQHLRGSRLGHDMTHVISGPDDTGHSRRQAIEFAVHLMLAGSREDVDDLNRAMCMARGEHTGW